MEKVNEDASLEFKWLKKRGFGGKNKEVQFYESFIYDGVKYMLYDCVYMYKDGLQEPYIGKIIKIWEREGMTKKVKVHWFFRPEEISKWLGDTKTLKNEILFASGEGVGLANINPLEAIAGPCNVICLSKDARNPQPSDEELKAADFVFYRTFDVQSCTISDKMYEEVGGLEIKYIFNRKEGESTSDRKEKHQNTTTSSKDDIEDIKLSEKGDAKDESQDRPSKKVKSGDKKPPEKKHVELEDSRVSEIMTDMPSKKSKVDISIKLPIDSKTKHLKASGTSDPNSEMGKTVEDKKRNKTPTGSNKLHDRPLKKMKSEDKLRTKEKQVELEVGQDFKRLTDMSSKKSKVDGSVKLPVDNKSKHEEKLPADVNNLKASGTSDTTEKRKNGKVVSGSDKGKISAKVTDDSEGKIIEKTNSFKIPDNNKKNGSNTNGSNGKDLVATSSLSNGKVKPGLAMDSVGTNKEPKEEQSGENRRKLSMSKSPKAAALSTDRDKKATYQEFVVGPKPNADKSGWFRRLPWEDRLKNAYDQGTAILLHNVDPDYTSGEVEDIIWHAFTENCEAKILQRTAVSIPHYAQALILLKTKEAAQRVLVKLDEECLMLSNGRPLVATPCPPISTKKNSNFFGHLTIDRCRIQNQREMDEAVSTSHFSQPNTIEYDMAMEWCLLQSRSKVWWEKMHKHQRLESKKLETNLLRK